jgi:bifunctional UDP-N-acetylglucosamine pyrophosphorylase / glucosamine-1-phosphate N-acetyltransferase
MDKVSSVILAAGKGSRLNCDIPKPLLPVCGKNMLDFVIEAVSLRDTAKVTLVLGHEKQKIVSVYENKVCEIVTQEQQLGTGHAVMSYLEQTKTDSKYILIACADTPLLTRDILEHFFNQVESKDLDAGVLTFEAKDPTGYGRIHKYKKGLSIVEEKDTSTDQKKITECNSGIYIFKRLFIEKMVKNLDTKNSQNEFYLTDVFKENLNVESFGIENGESTLMGVNDLIQLSLVESLLNKKKVQQLQRQGVLFRDPSSCLISIDCLIGPGTVVGRNVELRGKCTIGKGCLIDSGTIITDSIIGDETSVLPNSIIELSEVKENASVGPFARLRPATLIHSNAKIGNFVEVKKSQIFDGAKVSHLSYVGDSEIGKNTNIGCGFISCNYDGKNKHKTVIGENCFIGSDSQTVAPVNIGNNCFVASSTTVTTDMPDGSFGISRSKLNIKNGMASKFIKK